MNRMKVMTYNVQSWNTSDERKEALVNQIKSCDADLIGLQEVTPYWNKVIFENFEQEYYILGKYRLACLEVDPWNEKSAILVKKSLFTLIKERTFWLSSKPEEESIARNCKLPRVCTYAVLEIKNTNIRFVFANTHLDHLSSEGRENQCRFLIENLKELLNIPFILTGDFNSESSDNSYLYIKKFLKDSKFAFSNVDNTWTWHDNNIPDKRMLIDYIFINNQIEPLSYMVDTKVSNGKDISDHRPILLEFNFKN